MSIDHRPAPWVCDCPSPLVLDARVCRYCPECGATPESASLRLFPAVELQMAEDMAFAKGVLAALEADRA